MDSQFFKYSRRANPLILLFLGILGVIWGSTIFMGMLLFIGLYLSIRDTQFEKPNESNAFNILSRNGGLLLNIPDVKTHSTRNYHSWVINNGLYLLLGGAYLYLYGVGAGFGLIVVVLIFIGFVLYQIFILFLVGVGLGSAIKNITKLP